MFDNPEQKLKWMEQELLAAEEDEEDEIYDEFEDADEEYGDDDLMRLVNELVAEDDEGEPLRRRKNPTVDFPRMVYDDEEFDESAAVPAEASRKRQLRKAPEERKVRKKGIKGLVFLAFLEILGILAIIGWWLQWLI